MSYQPIKHSKHFFIIVFKVIYRILKLFYHGMKWLTRPLDDWRKLRDSLVVLLIAIYVSVSCFVIYDYLNKQYGWWDKFFCSIGARAKVQSKVVRIIGSYSEGTGFFINDHRILTNFHVINGEPTPKVVLPDGSFVTPTNIIGDQEADLALLTVDNGYPDLVMPLPDKIDLREEESLLATGFALGTDVLGPATFIKGNFTALRQSSKEKIGFVQTDISLVAGMSGGPLTDQCGQVVGVNTNGVSGTSFFIRGDQIKDFIVSFTDKDVAKIEVDPSKSPVAGVEAFYAYLKARRMEDGYKLLSKKYLKQAGFEEWSNRFKDVIDVSIIETRMLKRSKDTVSIKFTTNNWVDDEPEQHYYEGTWKTIKEDGVYKMLQSNIAEVKDPSLDWVFN